jgi:hypothetical protein
MTNHRLKVFGWGREHEAMTPDEETFALRTYQALFGVSAFETVTVPTLDALARGSLGLILLRPWLAYAPPHAVTVPFTPSASHIRTRCLAC